jgi:hypothetical protein
MSISMPLATVGCRYPFSERGIVGWLRRSIVRHSDVSNIDVGEMMEGALA